MSSPSDLTFFSYEIVGLVGRGGAGAHDLLRLAQRSRMLAWAGESQYYTEPKRLARLGYLDTRKEAGKTRPRTVYTLTDKGLEALRAYARTPVTIPPFKSEALLRLLIADLVGGIGVRGVDQPTNTAAQRWVMLSEQRLLAAVKREGRHGTSAGLGAPPGAGPAPAPPRPQGAILGRPGHPPLGAPTPGDHSAPPDDPGSYAAASGAGPATPRCGARGRATDRRGGRDSQRHFDQGPDSAYA